MLRKNIVFNRQKSQFHLSEKKSVFFKMTEDKKRVRESIDTELESPVKKPKKDDEPDQEIKSLLNSIKFIKQAVQFENTGDGDESKGYLEAQKILKWMVDYYRARNTKDGVRWCYVDISPEAQEKLKSWGIRVEQNTDHTDWWNLYP